MPTTQPKIMHVVEAFGGGVFQSVRQLCEAALPDAENIIVHGIRPETPKNMAEQYPQGTRFIHLPMARAINPKADFTQALALRRLVKAERPTVVHAHSSKAGALARIGLLGLGVPVYYSPRGYAFLMKDSSPLKRVLFLVVEWLLGRLPATTVACGYDEFEITQRISRKTLCIPNAFQGDNVPEAARTSPPFSGKKGEVLQVICSARITPQKNFEAFCAVAKALQNEPVAFTWIGGGESAGVEVPPNVHVTGWLNHADVMAHMAKGQVFLMLSRWEGFSRVTLEAMSYGFPLILSNVSGNREAITPQNGFSCATPEDAVAAIRILLAHPNRLQPMGQASLALLKNRYNWPTIQNMWRQTYGLTAPRA